MKGTGVGVETTGVGDGKGSLNGVALTGAGALVNGADGADGENANGSSFIVVTFVFLEIYFWIVDTVTSKRSGFSFNNIVTN